MGRYSGKIAAIVARSEAQLKAMDEKKAYKRLKQQIKWEANEKANKLLCLDPLKLENNLSIYLYNFAIKILTKYSQIKI